MAISIAVGGVTLPSPTELSTSDEIIWSSNTGRASDGNMVGDVVAEKKTLNIKWGVLTELETNIIKSNLVSGFVPITFRDDGSNITLTAYRGTLSKSYLGCYGGINYYKDISVNIIQQ